MKSHAAVVGTAAAVGSIALTLLVFYFTGWLSEDAYIVFRVVDNVLSGYGPVWNVGERLQIFTSPLWMGALSLVSAVLGSKPPLTALGVSLACNVVVMAVAAIMGFRRPLVLLLTLGWLFCSQAFLDYSTSGLENPLLHALVALISLVLWLEPGLQPFRALAAMSGLCALLLCTRLDAVFIAAPALAFVALRRRRELGAWRATLAILAGQIPFIGWECFSLVYYGSFLPNTALAKLPIGYPKGELARTGLVTVEASFMQDPGTVLCIVLIPAVLLLLRSRLWAASLIASAGTLVSTVAVGGDFMLGRFLSAVFVFSCLAFLAGSDARHARAAQGSPRFATPWRVPLLLFSVTAASFLSLSWQFQKMKFALKYDQQPFYKHQVADERSYYHLTAGVRAIRRGVTDPWISEGEHLRRTLGGRKALVAKRNVGMFGYAVGPDTFIIDLLALGNPFLARLPACPSHRAGHFGRPMPNGYAASLLDGRNRLADPLLAMLYDDIALATRASLGEPGRLAAIWRLNTSFYGDAARLARYATMPEGVLNIGYEKKEDRYIPCPGGPDIRDTYVLRVAALGTQEPPWQSSVFPK